MSKFIIQRENVENAVLRVSDELNSFKKLERWENLREEQLWIELVSCILGSKVRDGLAKQFVAKLKKQRLLTCKKILKAPKKMMKRISVELNTPITTDHKSGTKIRYPFSKLRAAHIVQTCVSIYKTKPGALKKILKLAADEYEARDMLIELCMGIGPKQASLFLRNISYCDNLAIFDSHVIRYMRLIGLIREDIRVFTKKQYLKYEKILISYSNLLNKTLAVLDFAIWIVMRVVREECEYYGSSCSYVWRS